ncbi:unnamed protein product [Linum trigynum]|uniref:RNase H type-1 domain-containing protein n=1 Tax=Linum trigynum TaxID=586398 RepID=A0AAV2ETH8_9ROSI
MRQYHQQHQEWAHLPMDQGVRREAVPPQPVLGAGDDRMVCQWDGATKCGSHSAGGMVLLDQEGQTIIAHGTQYPVVDDPMVVELLVLREAILWCLGMGLSAVRFEGDAKVVIDKVLQADNRDSRMGAILEEVIGYLSVHRGLSVRFVGRRNNRVALRVARKALLLYPAASRCFDFNGWLRARM